MATSRLGIYYSKAGILRLFQRVGQLVEHDPDEKVLLPELVSEVGPVRRPVLHDHGVRDERGLTVDAPDGRRGRGCAAAGAPRQEIGRVDRGQVERHVVLVTAHDPDELELKLQDGDVHKNEIRQ